MKPLRQLKKFPQILPHLRRTPRVPPQIKKAPFSLLISKRGSISRFGKGVRASHRTASGGSPQFETRGSPGVVPDFQKTPKSQSTPDKPDSPKLSSTVTPIIDSKHNGRWDIPLAPRERQISLGQPERKPETTFTAQEESRLKCLPYEMRPTPMLKLHRKTRDPCLHSVRKS